MSYHAKKTITSLIAGLIILVQYSLSAYRVYMSGLHLNDAQFWAQHILIYVAIGIGVTIVLHILFHIYLSIQIAIRDQVKDDKTINRKLEYEMIEDEMNKLIELKSLKLGYALTGVGFMISLALLAFGYSFTLVLNLMFFSFYLGSFAEGISTLFFYFKGVNNA